MMKASTGRHPLTNNIFAAEKEEAERRDKALVRRVLAGDNSAFGTLMSLNTRRLHALGMSFFKNAADSDDFVQDVFIKAYTHLSSFKGNSAFSTWLIRIGYNTAINSLNRRKEYVSLSDIDEPSTTDTPEEAAIRRATMEAVREAAKLLPEAYKICVDLYFFYGMQYKEIMKTTGFPVGTIKSHIFRAKKLLKVKLEGLV